MLANALKIILSSIFLQFLMVPTYLCAMDDQPIGQKRLLPKKVGPKAKNQKLVDKNEQLEELVQKGTELFTFRHDFGDSQATCLSFNPTQGIAIEYTNNETQVQVTQKHCARSQKPFQLSNSLIAIPECKDAYIAGTISPAGSITLSPELYSCAVCDKEIRHEKMLLLIMLPDNVSYTLSQRQDYQGCHLLDVKRPYLNFINFLFSAIVPEELRSTIYNQCTNLNWDKIAWPQLIDALIKFHQNPRYKINLVPKILEQQTIDLYTPYWADKFETILLHTALQYGMHNLSDQILHRCNDSFNYAQKEYRSAQSTPINIFSTKNGENAFEKALCCQKPESITLLLDITNPNAEFIIELLKNFNKKNIKDKDGHILYCISKLENISNDQKSRLLKLAINSVALNCFSFSGNKNIIQSILEKVGPLNDPSLKIDAVHLFSQILKKRNDEGFIQKYRGGIDASCFELLLKNKMKASSKNELLLTEFVKSTKNCEKCEIYQFTRCIKLLINYGCKSEKAIQSICNNKYIINNLANQVVYTLKYYKPSLTEDKSDQAMHTDVDEDLITEGRKLLNTQCKIDANRSVHFNPKDGIKIILSENTESSFDKECSISGNKFKIESIIGILPCNHFFMFDSIVPIKKCPLCRFDIASTKEITPLFISDSLDNLPLTLHFQHVSLPSNNIHDNNKMILLDTQKSYFTFIEYLFSDDVSNQSRPMIYEKCTKLNWHAIQWAPVVDRALKENKLDLAKKLIDLETDLYQPYTIDKKLTNLLHTIIDCKQASLIRPLLESCRNPLSFALEHNAFNCAITNRNIEAFKELIEITKPSLETINELFDRLEKIEFNGKELFLQVLYDSPANPAPTENSTCTIS